MELSWDRIVSGRVPVLESGLDVVITAASGDVVAVIGRRYDHLLSSNSVKLKAEAAKGIVMMKIG